jgi:hypothetical protein
LADGVLLINLEHRTDRLQRFAELAARHPLLANWRRLPAVNGTDLPGFGAKPWFRGRQRDKCIAGRAGCTLSHRNAIARAKELGWDRVLILEDDVLADESFAADAAAFLTRAAADPDWGVCFLGWSQQIGPAMRLSALGGRRAIYQVFGCIGAFAYLVKREHYDWLLAGLPTPETVWPWIAAHRAVDRWYARNLSTRCKVWAVSPNLIGHYASFSDIGQRAGPDLPLAAGGEEGLRLEPCGPAAFASRAGLLRVRFGLAGWADRTAGLLRRVRGL